MATVHNMDIMFVPPKPNARKSGAIISSFIASIANLALLRNSR
jgi:hypothetical protein